MWFHSKVKGLYTARRVSIIKLFTETNIFGFCLTGLGYYKWGQVTQNNLPYSFVEQNFFFFGVRSNFNKLKTPDHEIAVAGSLFSAV